MIFLAGLGSCDHLQFSSGIRVLLLNCYISTMSFANANQITMHPKYYSDWPLTRSKIGDDHNGPNLFMLEKS